MDIFAETLDNLIKTKVAAAKLLKKPRAPAKKMDPEEEQKKIARQEAHLRKTVLTLCNGGAK